MVNTVDPVTLEPVKDIPASQRFMTVLNDQRQYAVMDAPQLAQSIIVTGKPMNLVTHMPLNIVELRRLERVCSKCATDSTPLRIVDGLETYRRRAEQQLESLLVLEWLEEDVADRWRSLMSVPVAAAEEPLHAAQFATARYASALHSLARFSRARAMAAHAANVETLDLHVSETMEAGGDGLSMQYIFDATTAIRVLQRQPRVLPPRFRRAPSPETDHDGSHSSSNSESSASTSSVVGDEDNRDTNA